LSVRRVLVTGGSGFIGRHVVRACSADGWRVVAVDPRPPPPDLVDRANICRGSFADPACLAEVGAGAFDAVIHLGAISSTLTRDWPALERTNVSGPGLLAERCAASGTRFVYASSSSVYGRIFKRRPTAENSLGSASCSGPLNEYARSKALFDLRMETELGSSFGPRGWTGLRFTNVFGDGEAHKGAMVSIINQLVTATARGERLVLFADTLEACRDYVPVTVVAETCRLMIAPGAPSGVFNLGSSEATSFAELLRWCAEFRGAKLDVRLVPNPHANRYQYWTRADMAALDRALPHRPRVRAGDIRAAARVLYDHAVPGQ
jgi:ADP-L-glycero-D-manno-heptose 6-epimerase